MTSGHTRECPSQGMRCPRAAAEEVELYRDTKKARDKPLTCGYLVARTRFELVISALRGRRPEPLDERAISEEEMAGTERIELPLTEPESVVLPLDEVPVVPRAFNARNNIPHRSKNCKHYFDFFAENNPTRYRSHP